MTTSTILLLLLSVLVAAGLSFYHYLYKAKINSKLNLILAFLRFLSVFLLLVLLINPVISRKTFEVTKVPLPVLVDNSQSIKELGQEQVTEDLLKQLKANSSLQNKFDVQFFKFDRDFTSLDRLDFQGNQTHIDQAAQNLKQLYRSQHYPVLMLTDGNQTIGNDYVYSFQENAAVYPIVLGDTTSYFDLKINQLNANKYAFLKNKFPVEVFLQYSGNKPVNATFSIFEGNSVVHKQNIAFSPAQKTKVVSILLNANRVGVQKFKAVISSSEKEKNSYNNSKNFAVEIIDQRTEIAIISSVIHPDLGALKKAIESNSQRKVTIVNPKEIKSLQNFNVLIFYQPGAEFKSIFEQNDRLKLNSWLITGTDTDFNFLNQNQKQVVFKISSQQEDYSASYNSLFNTFAVDNIGFERFPPLEHPLGTILMQQNSNVLLKATIRNITTENPLLAFSENNMSRSAYLFGENLWKWRMESHLQSKSFENFDVFIDKTIQYLASNSSKKSLMVEHESFYNSGESIEITAQYFNKNYEFDEKANLTIQLQNKENNTSKAYNFIKGENEFKVRLDGLKQGSYKFTVKENNSKTNYSGSFEVLDFNFEKQFVNPDVNRLKEVATNTNGKVFYPNQLQTLIDYLEKQDIYKPMEKAVIKQTPLIDWIWIMILLSVSLAAEWFIRKYNGLL